MNAHLLLIALGPVQDFIAQARRTRDLWYGSHLLSELGRGAARALVDYGGELVFPSLKKGDPELEACQGPLRENGTPPLNVANKLIAQVPPGVDPRELARNVRTGVMTYWRDHLAGPVKERCAGLLADEIDTVWTEQVETFLEFVAAWAPLADYADTRRMLEQAIAGRKVLRNFNRWRHARGSVPKSSLDGARETVLRPPERRDTKLVGKYRIAEGEQLDAVGLVKRAGGEPDQFVPVVNIALASWVKLASEMAGPELNRLKNECRAIGVSPVSRPDLPCVAPFPFDASVLLPSRWRSVFKEQGFQGDPDGWGGQFVNPIIRKLSDPYPYVACLVADGDRMGRAIDRLGSVGEHRQFSAALAGFAAEARKVVEQDHQGALIYSGGDDVLAFLPLPTALSCADDLRKAFAHVMNSACRAMPAEERPTLSVGLGVGHVMESMGHLLALGRQAEREAKRSRNALAVVVDKRSGGTRSWSASWSEDPVGLLHNGISLLESRLSSRKVYEIASMLGRLPRRTHANVGPWTRVLALEVTRSLARVEDGPLRPDDVGLALDASASYAALYGQIDAWVKRMLIARTFVQARPRTRRNEEAAA